MQYYVYCIGHKHDMIEPYDRCYIGVTHFIMRRWRNHLQSPFRVGNTIRKYSFTMEDNFAVIFRL